MKKLLLLLTALVAIGIVSLNREALASPGPTAEPTEQAILEDALPDSELTPGDDFANIAVTDLAQPGYSKHVRHVTEETRRQVFAEYEIAWEQRNEYEGRSSRSVIYRWL
jgi:hypothetical protein